MDIQNNLSGVFISCIVTLFIFLCTIRNRTIDEIEKRFIDACKRINWQGESFRTLYRGIKKGLSENNVLNKQQFINLTQEYKRERIINYILLPVFLLSFLFVVFFIK